MSQHSSKTLQRLKELKEKRQKLNARIQQTESRLKTSDRKKDTRRKILVGAWYLEQAGKENRMDEISSIMQNYLTRESDRKLFDCADTISGVTAISNSSVSPSGHSHSTHLSETETDMA